MMMHTFDDTCVPATRFFLTPRRTFAYNRAEQHPPRIPLELRTMGGYFFLGAEK